MCTVSEEEEEEEVGIVLYLHHPVDVFHVVHMLVHIQITSSRLHPNKSNNTLQVQTNTGAAARIMYTLIASKVLETVY
jgi:hypothetical protein